MTTPPLTARLLASGLDETTIRRVRTLAAATAASAIFAVIGYEPLKLVTVSPTIAVLLPAAAAITAAGAQLRRPALIAGTGTLLVLGGLVRLATYGHGQRPDRRSLLHRRSRTRAPSSGETGRTPRRARVRSRCRPFHDDDP